MFEEFLQHLRSMLRPAMEGVALVVAIGFFFIAPTIAKSLPPAANNQSTVLDLSLEQCWSGAGHGTAQLTFRRDRQHNHLWIARIASLELRLEWGSAYGHDTWSVTIADLKATKAANTSANATDECI